MKNIKKEIHKAMQEPDKSKRIFLLKEIKEKLIFLLLEDIEEQPINSNALEELKNIKTCIN